MQTKLISSSKHYKVEKRSCYRSCATLQTEWVVIGIQSGLIVASYKTKREALEWVTS